MIKSLKGMLRIVKYLTILIGMLSLIYGCSHSAGKEYTDNDIVSLVKTEFISSRFRRADAVILLDQKIITVKADASFETAIHQVVKLNSSAGIRQFGDLKFAYNGTTETIKIIKARTFKPNGSSVPVEKKAINTLTQNIASEAPEYQNHKLKVVSFPALETGAIIEIKLKKVTRNKSKLADLRFAGSEVFQSTIPVIFKELVVQVPKDMPFYFKSLNGLSDPSIVKTEYHDTYAWRSEIIHSIQMEPNMPPFRAFAPTVYYTNRSHWDDSGRWFRDRFYSRVAPGPKTAALVSKLTTGITEEKEKIERIYRFVVVDINDVNVSIQFTNFEPKSVYSTLKNRYGNNLDKSLLLISMLKAANIDAYPVLASTTLLEADFLPTLDLFSRMYVQIIRKGKEPLILNPMSKACSSDQRPAIRDFSALVIQPTKTQFIQRVAISQNINQLKTNLSFTLNERGDAAGKLAFGYEGYYDCYIRKIRNRSDEQIQPMLIAISRIFGEGTYVEDYSLSNLADRQIPAKLTLEFTAPEFGVVQGDLMILRLPPVIPRYLFINTASDKRWHDLRPEFLPTIEVKGSIKIPPDYNVFRIPSSSVIKHKSDKISVNYHFDSKKQTIRFKFKVIIRSNPITKEEYPGFKGMIDKFRSQINRLILLKKIPTS